MARHNQCVLVFVDAAKTRSRFYNYVALNLVHGAGYVYDLCAHKNESEKISETAFEVGKV